MRNNNKKVVGATKKTPANAMAQKGYKDRNILDGWDIIPADRDTYRGEAEDYGAAVADDMERWTRRIAEGKSINYD